LHHPGAVRSGGAAGGSGAPSCAGGARRRGRRMSRRARRGATALLLATLSGCAVGPNYTRPALPLPPQFYGQEAAITEARSLADLPWWELFDDPVLQALIDEALRNGFDARLAAARVEEAPAPLGGRPR